MTNDGVIYNRNFYNDFSEEKGFSFFEGDVITVSFKAQREEPKTWIVTFTNSQNT